MDIPADFQITTQNLWTGTLIFAVLDALWVPLLAWKIREKLFQRIEWPLIAITALFWGGVWTVMAIVFWDPIYSYVFPGWIRWYLPFIMALLFANVCWAMFWAAHRLRLPGSPVSGFFLLWGVWGGLTHLTAVWLGIVSYPPALVGASPVAAVVIALFEYIFYGCLILTLAWIVGSFPWSRLQKQRLRQA